MTRPGIKNLTELNAYLTVLEDQIVKLESQDQEFKTAINDVNQDLQQVHIITQSLNCFYYKNQMKLDHTFY